MPVTGTFLANFLDFIRGAKSAEDALASLEKGGEHMGAALDKSIGKMDIEKLITHPVETGTDALRDFAGELGTVGIVGTAAVAGIAAAGGAILTMANNAANTAAHLGDLADVTGMTVPELSMLANAAYVAGTTLDVVADISFKLQQRMAKSPNDFAEGLRLLNINADRFKSLSIEKQFEAVARSLAATEDPQKRITAGTDLLGKSYQGVAAALVDVGGAIDQVKGKGPVFSKKDADAADEYQQQLRLLKLEAKGIADEIGTYVVPKLASATSYLKIYIDTLRGIKDEPLPLPKGLTDEDDKRFNQFAGSLAGLRDAIHLTSEAELRNKELTKQWADEQSAAQVEVKKFADAVAEVNSAGVTWRDTLSKMDSVTVAMTKELLAAGVAAGTVATYMHLTDTQVRAVDASMKDEAKTASEMAKTNKDAADAMQTLWADYYDATTAESDNATERQIANMWKAANAQGIAMAGVEGAQDLIVATAVAREAKIRGENAKTRDDYIYNVTAAEKAFSEANARGDVSIEARNVLWRNMLTAQQALAAFEDTHAENTVKTMTTIDGVTVNALSKIDEAWIKTTASQRGYSDELVATALHTAELGRSSLDTSGKLAAMAALLDEAHKRENAQTYTLPDSGFEQVTKFGQQYLVDKATGGRLISQALDRVGGGAGGFLGYGLPQGVNMRDLQIQLNGLLMANDPAARSQLSDVISRTVTDTLKSQGVRLGNA